MTGRLSRNCREGKDQPLDTHVCTGCPDCPCHHVEAPIDLRKLVEDAKAGER